MSCRIIRRTIIARDDVGLTTATVVYNIPPAKPIEHWPCARALADALGGCRSWKAHSRNVVATASYIQQAAARDPRCSENIRALSWRQYHDDDDDDDDMCCVCLSMVHLHHTHTSCRAFHTQHSMCSVSRIIIIVYYTLLCILENIRGLYLNININAILTCFYNL